MVYLLIVIASWFNIFFIQRKSYALFVISFSWMAYLGGLASPVTTTDYPNYYTYYQMTAAGMDVRLEWLYTLLSRRAALLGLDYAQFRLILIGFTFLILFVAVIRLCKAPILFTACFMIFPFFNEITQVRTFVAFSIILLATSFIEPFSVKRIVFFEILTILAMGFHSSAGVFIFLPLIGLAIKKRDIAYVSKTIDVATIIFTLFLVAFSSISALTKLIGNILLTVAGTKTSASFLNLMAVHSGRKLFFLEILVAYLLVKQVIWYYSLDKSKINISVYSLFLYGELLTPLLLLSDQMQRFPRFGIETAFLIIGTIVAERINANRQVRLMVLLTLILVLSNAFLYYGLTNPSAPFPSSVPYLAHFKN